MLNQHVGQSRAWNSTARFVYVLAGAQSGKTSWGPFWLLREIQRTALPAGGTNDYAAVTSSYDLFKLKMLPALREVFEHLYRVGRYWSTDRVIELRDPASGQFWAKSSDDRMWGRIILRSASAGGGLESMTGRGAWADECGQDEFTVEAIEALRRRLALYQGRQLGTTTPYSLGWLYQVWQEWTRGKRPDTEFVTFKSTCNPLFSRAEYESAKASMPEWRFRMFYDGEFTRPAGLIYGAFNEQLHKVAPFAIPPEWPRYVGWDFGGANTATVWLAENPSTGVYTLYRESLAGHLTTREHAEDARKVGAEVNVVGQWGGAAGEVQPRADFGDHGVSIWQPPVSDVEQGIDRVTELLKSHRLRITSDCVGVLDELGAYRRRVGPTGEVLEEIVDKRQFHRLDALRYVVSGISSGSVSMGPSLYE